MKRLLVLLVVLATMLTLVIGCSSSANEQPEEKTPLVSVEDLGVSVEDLEDGIYEAQEEDFDDNSGWKNIVTIEVKDGKIVDAKWNGIHKDGGDDKVTKSINGEYGMVEHGNANAEWHEQAALVEAYLLEVQDPTDIKYSNEEGNTDAITGATIHVKEFFDLAIQALKSQPK
jgi:major membrane immunogen (membrane-anchored lipoprotein)